MAPLLERFIKRLDAHEPLDDAAKEGLRRSIQLVPLTPPGEILVENAPPDLSILLHGWVCHYRLFGNGRRQITSLVLPGDVLDFGFLTGRDAQLQYRVTAPTQFGRIRLAQFIEIADQFPAIMRAMLQASAMEAAIRQERVISLGLRSAVERVSHLMCEMALRLAVVDMVSADNTFDLPMTQADIGEALGLSMVHVNRTLQLLRRSGAINFQRGRVTLLDRERLAQMAAFDASYIEPSSSSDVFNR